MNLSDFLQSQIDSDDIVIDIGSGNKKNQNFNCQSITSLDAWDIANPDVCIDLEESKIPFEENSFDVVLMIDFIEHVTKDSGIRLISESIKIAKKKVILLTPLWWDDNSKNTKNKSLWCYNNPYNYHKSLWNLNDFIGWERINISGLENYFLGIYHV